MIFRYQPIKSNQLPALFWILFTYCPIMFTWMGTWGNSSLCSSLSVALRLCQRKIIVVQNSPFVARGGSDVVVEVEGGCWERSEVMRRRSDLGGHRTLRFPQTHRNTQSRSHQRENKTFLFFEWNRKFGEGNFRFKTFNADGSNSDISKLRMTLCFCKTSSDWLHCV